MKKMVDGIVIECTAEEEAEIRARWVKDGERRAAIAYSESRREEYPGIGDQLDMLWHAMDIGEIPRAEDFYDRIKAVKDKYPKNR